MLIEIREKAQGFFAWVILLLICVPFALWGVQNYTGSSGERPLASVGHKDFFQKEVAQAAAQLSQNLAGMNVPEESIKAQALKKLIGDEVLLQHVEDDGLEVTDETARNFVRALPYFQTDGRFDEKQYKAVLSAQGMSPASFTQRIKQSLKMEQFQRAIMESSFATQADVDNVFKIQNQQRNVEYVTIPVSKLSTQPTADEVQAYYQQHQTSYQTPEQVAVEYVELSADELAKAVVATDAQLQAFYQEQKDQYTTKERRKISHILFTTTKDTTAEQALQKAVKAEAELKSKDFAVLAKELSDDKLTAEKGGDLGLFTPGVMDKDFEAAASSLALGAVSAPVKSTFGYHLIKVTELVPGEVKPFTAVKDDVTKAYQKAQSESQFYELGEKMAQLSYENSGSLSAVAEGLKLKTQKTALLSKDSVSDIFSEAKVRTAAFSEEVLNGNNSEPVEMGLNRLVVLRLLEHKPAATQALKDVEPKVVAALLADKAKQQSVQVAEKIQQRLQAGESIATVAAEQQLQIQKLSDITRDTNKLPAQISQAVFKAPKPLDGKPAIAKMELDNGEQVVMSVSSVKPGVMTDDDKKKQLLASKNIAKAFGQSVFAAVMKSLETSADVTINK
ncbi:MAG: SurA N-terminal domain-containing protein [Methylococcales bacterium]|nr:SurA N-terminal domain-containing protein [Methylococcales bacterium]